MNESSVWLVAVLMIGGIIVVAVYGVIAAKKRRDALAMLSARLGVAFDPGPDRSIPDRFNFLKQLAQGSNRYALNILSGEFRQNDALVFDYHYETTSTDSKGNTQTQDHWFSFFILTLPAVFPNLTIRHANFFTKVAEVFGYQDIKFESAEFSKTFCVRSPDRKFAYDVCNTRAFSI